MSSTLESGPLALSCNFKMCCQRRRRCKPLGKEHHRGWESRLSSVVLCVRSIFYESHSSELECKLGGKFHLKLNMGSKPIANKYHEGKMKRTLKRELKVFEIAERKADGTSVAWWDCCVLWWLPVTSAQALWWVLSWMCVVFLTLCVTVGLGVRITCEEWKLCRGEVNASSWTHS